MPALTRMLGIASNSPLTTRDIPVLVIRAAVTMAAFFGSAPGLRAQAPASADQGASRQATVAKKAVAELDPFDLSYVPVEAKSIVACRPSAILRREDMKRHAETIQSLIVGLIDPEANLESQVKVREIEQLTMGFMRSTGDEKKSGPSGLDTGVLAVRACHDVDWKKSIIGSGAASDWVVVGFSGRTYYKLKETRTQPPGEPAQDLCFYFPDRRTAVIAEGEGLLRGLMRPPAGSQPVLAVTSGWQEIHRGLIAAACEQDDPEDVLDEVSDVGMFLIDAIRLDLKGARRYFSGIDEAENYSLRVSMDCRDANEANRVVLACNVQLDKLRGTESLPGVNKPGDAIARFYFRWASDLARGSQVHRHRSTVEVAAGCKVRLTEIVAVMEDLESTTPDKDHKPEQK